MKKIILASSDLVANTPSELEWKTVYHKSWIPLKEKYKTTDGIKNYLKERYNASYHITQDCIYQGGPLSGSKIEVRFYNDQMLVLFLLEWS